MTTFAKAYVACALWSSTNDDGGPLDEMFTIDSLTPEALATIQAECGQFESDNAEALSVKKDPGDGGHDFWFTRNGHGAGFWDGDWPEAEGQLLTNASKKAGSRMLIVGDDNRLHYERD